MAVFKQVNTTRISQLVKLTKKLRSRKRKFAFNSIDLLFVLGAGLISLSIVGQAEAAPITFIHQGSGSGTLDGQPFGLSDFTITAKGDTDNRESLTAGFFTNHDTASIFIDGIGTFEFVTPTRTFITNANLVGFSHSGILGTDLFSGPLSASLDGWDMLTSIGPVSGNGSLQQWNLGNVQTDGGILFFNNGQTPATFLAIPEPLTILGAATAAGFGAFFKRQINKKKKDK